MEYFNVLPEDRLFNSRREKRRSLRDARLDYTEAAEAYCCTCEHVPGTLECSAAKAAVSAAFDTFLELANTPVRGE